MTTVQVGINREAKPPVVYMLIDGEQRINLSPNSAREIAGQLGRFAHEADVEKLQTGQFKQ
jgi:hypothetical protein